jgi:hypothetical protein
MCPLCAATAALTAASATTATAAIATWGIGLARLVAAGWRTLKSWLLRQLSNESNTAVGERNEH